MVAQAQKRQIIFLGVSWILIKMRDLTFDRFI